MGLQYRIGRFLQLVGLLVTPQGVVLNAVGNVTLRQSLAIAAGGVGLFLVGWCLQRAGRP